MKSPQASRSVLSRWMSGGHRESLHLDGALRPSPFLPAESRQAEAGVKRTHEARRYLLSFPCPQRNDRCSAVLRGGVHLRVYPRRHLPHNAGGPGGEAGASFFFYAAWFRAFAPGLTETALTCVYVSTRTNVLASACSAPGKVYFFFIIFLFVVLVLVLVSSLFPFLYLLSSFRVRLDNSNFFASFCGSWEGTHYEDVFWVWWFGDPGLVMGKFGRGFMEFEELVFRRWYWIEDEVVSSECEKFVVSDHCSLIWILLESCNVEIRICS